MGWLRDKECLMFLLRIRLCLKKQHDIFVAVSANTADIEVVHTEVTDGVLMVEFEHVVENPKAST